MYSIRYVPFVFVLFLVFFSCSSSKSWITVQEDDFPSIYVGEVLVDKASGWASVEREIRDMVPLVFSEYGYPFVRTKVDAVYIVDVQAVEREYMSGWKTKHSAAIEIRVYENSGGDVYQNTVPVVVGKTISSGAVSLASSIDMGNLLGAGIKKIVKSLEMVVGNSKKGN
jgi:hypothetical protein